MQNFAHKKHSRFAIGFLSLFRILFILQSKHINLISFVFSSYFFFFGCSFFLLSIWQFKVYLQHKDIFMPFPKENIEWNMNGKLLPKIYTKDCVTSFDLSHILYTALLVRIQRWLEQTTVGATGLVDTLWTAYRLNRLIIDATILQRNGSQQTVRISFMFGKSNHRNRVDISNKYCTRKCCTLHGKVKGFKMCHNTNELCICRYAVYTTVNSLKKLFFCQAKRWLFEKTISEKEFNK